jgi:hypothetical protein
MLDPDPTRIRNTGPPSGEKHSSREGLDESYVESGSKIFKHKKTIKFYICVKKARPMDDLELDLILRYLAV